MGAVLALSAALAATCFVKAFGITFLGRPRSSAAAQARETDRFSLATLFLLATLCALAGVLPGFVIDGLASVVSLLTGGAHLPAQRTQPWLTLVPVAAVRGTYNGLLVLLFIAFSALLSAWLVHRFASNAARRGAAWDCGFPESNPAAQYTAGSFAQPIRRVFGSVVFQAQEQVDIPPPGDQRPARLHVRLHDPAWDYLYTPLAAAVEAVADRLNHLQFLSIRLYLSLVFGALVLLLIGLALWQ